MKASDGRNYRGRTHDCPRVLDRVDDSSMPTAADQDQALRRVNDGCFRQQLLLGRQRDFLNRETDRRGCVEEHEYDFLRRQKKLPR